MTALPLTSALDDHAGTTAGVLRAAHDLLHRSRFLLAPAVGLGAALMVAARGNSEALDAAALALACAIGADSVARGLGMRSLDLALDTWCHEHDERALTHPEALSFIVQALALL